jgi:ABC-type nitrate/sulfonate/bicarbonate transport system ATPase subunit
MRVHYACAGADSRRLKYFNYAGRGHAEPGRNVVELTAVHKSFDEVQVLKGLSAHVKEGELVSVLGPSGCGKSTLMNIITGILRSDSGNVSISGKIGYMQQKDLLLPWRTILDNVILPQSIGGRKKSAAREEAAPYFNIFGLEGYENKYPYELSGGMRQRASFLRAFLAFGDIMLLDEPFGALDSITRRKLQEWLLEVKKETGVTILFITHDIEEAILLSDRIYILSEKPSAVRAEIALDFHREDKGQRLVSPRFIGYKKQILKNL